MVYAPTVGGHLPTRRKEHKCTVLMHVSLFPEVAAHLEPHCEVVVWTTVGRKEASASLKKTAGVHHCIYSHTGIWTVEHVAQYLLHPDSTLVIERHPNVCKCHSDGTVLVVESGEGVRGILRAFQVQQQGATRGGQWDLKEHTVEVCYRDDAENAFVCRAVL